MEIDASRCMNKSPVNRNSICNSGTQNDNQWDKSTFFPDGASLDDNGMNKLSEKVIKQERKEIKNLSFNFDDGKANEWDVSTYLFQVPSLDDKGIEKLIKNVIKPDSSFSFPKRSHRSFRLEWLTLYDWLAYSPSKDGAYCLPCVLFGKKCSKFIKVKKLYSEPFTYWPDATAAFKRHIAPGGLHSKTEYAYAEFCKRITGKSKPIDILIDSNRSKLIKENRKKLVPIVDTIIVCARQGLALRGHRDDSKYHPQPGGYSIEPTGNFVELLNYRIRGGDEVLQKHLSNCPKNATYISKSTQNELINACGEVITEKIISEVKQNKFYTVLADEACDTSTKEQMAVVIRYVDNQYNIREDFVRFLHCRFGLTGESLSTLLLDCIENDLGLRIENCRGQGYDGAGNMAGKINGLAAHIRDKNYKAIYVHCSSHRLNLCVAKSCTITLVRNTMEKIKHISYFFNFSEKRKDILTELIKSYAPASRKTKLIDVCRTRWIETIEGMEIMQELYVPILLALEKMSQNIGPVCNPDTASQALSFLHDIDNFEFIVTMVIVRTILAYTHGVTKLLQDKQMDIMDNVSQIENLKNTIMNCRNEIEFFHNKWYDEALLIAKNPHVNVVEINRRVVKRQIFRDNQPHLSVRDYYKKSLTIPFLDHLISEMKTRFDFTEVNVYNGLCIVPQKMVTLIGSSKINWKENFKLFVNFYFNDLPNPLGLDNELHLWEQYWLNYHDTLPDTVAKTLISIDLKLYANLNILLRILATIPVTTCECERSISALGRLKNCHRSTMEEERLNGLALMHIHQEIVPNIDEVINVFARDQRRLELI